MMTNLEDLNNRMRQVREALKTIFNGTKAKSLIIVLDGDDAGIVSNMTPKEVVMTTTNVLQRTLTEKLGYKNVQIGIATEDHPFKSDEDVPDFIKQMFGEDADIEKITFPSSGEVH